MDKKHLETNHDQHDKAPHNITSYIIYAILIATTLYINEPKMSLVELLTSTIFMIVWTLVAGYGIFFTTIYAFLYVFAKDSKIDQLATKYVSWIAPLIGFVIFVCTL